MRKRIRTEEEKKKQTSLQFAARSRSKEIIERLKRIYKFHPSQHESPLIMTQIKNNSPHKNLTPNKNLKLTILSRSKTPRQNSPCTNPLTFTNNRQYQTNLNTARRLEELKRKMTENRPFGKLNGTQRYFKKQKDLAGRVDNNMNQTLRMVWELKPKKPKYEFKMIKKLGKSQTGQIILAVSNVSSMIVAIKTFAKKDVKIDYLIDELKIHLCCRHPNVLPAYGININSEEVYLAMEVGQGNLYQKIIKQGPFDQQTVAVYISQIANGVAYLHQLGVMHRDIKPQNIICFGNNLKIADFGWSIITTRPRKTLCGTLDYLSPEVANRESYNNKIDCWSIGVLMYELITGQAPFPQQQLKQMTFEQITLPKGISAQAKDLLLKMLQVNPINRLSAKQILQHQWIKFHTGKAKQENRKTNRKLQIELSNILS